MVKNAFLIIFLACLSCFGAESVTSGNTTPNEVGMYHRNSQGAWEELEARSFTSKTGGVIKEWVTLGIIKRDLNANLWQRSALNSASYQEEFLVVVGEGVSIGEYQMIRFREHRNSREFRMKTGGVFHQSTGNSRDDQEFTSKKIAARTYLVSFPTYQGGGQFGFLPPPSYVPTDYAAGRVYCFEMRN